MNKTAVLWVRVSSKPQASGYSLDSQERLVTEAAKDYEKVRNPFRVTESAKTSEARREFKAMINFVLTNKIGHVFAWSHDRLARHYKDFTTLQTLIDDHDVSIHLVESNKEINRRSPISDRFMFQVMAAMAESDNRKRGENTKAGMDQKAIEGGVPHLTPIGYLNITDPTDTNPELDKRRKIVVKDEVRAPLVTWAFEAFAKGGWTLESMAAELNRRGLTTKPGPKRPARMITPGFLHKVLTNRFFYGEFPHAGVYRQGKYEPLVTRELWNQVQGRLTRNRTRHKPGARKWFLFRPFTVCGHCRSHVTAYDTKGRHGKGLYAYYECTNSKKIKVPDYYRRKFGTDDCIQRRWTEKEIEKFVEGEIGKLYLNDFIAGKIRERLKRTNAEEETYERKELRRLEAEKTRKKNHLKISYLDRMDGRITIERYAEVQAETQADLDRIEADIKRLTARNFKYREQGSMIIELLQGVKEVYTKSDQQGQRRWLEVLVKEIVLQKDPVVVWQEPFDTLFALGEVFREKGIWGE